MKNTNAIAPMLECSKAHDDRNVFLNNRCYLHDRDGFRVVCLSGIPLFRVALDDKIQLRLVAVSLHQGGYATQEEIAAAFRHSVATQRRWERRFEAEGLAGLMKKAIPGRPAKVNKGQLQFVKRWFREGVSNYEMARRIGVSEAAIRRALKRLGLARDPAPRNDLPFSDTIDATPVGADIREAPNDMAVVEQGRDDGQVRDSSQGPSHDSRAPGVSDPGAVNEKKTVTAGMIAARDPLNEAVATGVSLDLDPLDRVNDRALAANGYLDDALPIFADADCVPRAGVLLAIPLLAASGVIDVFQKLYCSIGPAFYGLRTSVVCLVLLALLRIKRPENIKEFNPGDLGRILGLDRAPEVKTLRRKLQAMAARGKGAELMQTLAQSRVVDNPERMGFLYFDGHVREYSGKHALGKAHITNRRISAPAATDTWVNDVNGDPMFVVTSELNAGLTKVLEPLLAEVKEMVGEGVPLTAVFDRGGYSPAMFARLAARDIHVVTYRKGKAEPVDTSLFIDVVFKIDGQEHKYSLHDEPAVPIGVKRRVGDARIPYLLMRQVTRLRRDGEHQTQVLTTRDDLPAGEVLYRMFNRWRQENFFKYMLDEFALDALTEYGVEDLSPDADRPNPELKKLRNERAQAKRELDQLRLALLEYQAGTASDRRARGTKVAFAELPKAIFKAESKVEQLAQRIERLPKRVPASDLKQLKVEQRLVVDAIKMTAYQLETDLLNLLYDIYPRAADEGRTLLHAAFQSSARLEVHDKELRITIAAQSSPHRTAALDQLCTLLNELGATFPGTDLDLQLSVSAAEPLTS